MGMYWCLCPRGAAGVVDTQEILWRADRRDRAYLCHPGSAGRGSALQTECEEPDLTGNFGGQRRLACSGLRQGEIREILEPPEQRPSGKLLELLFSDVVDYEFLLRLCVR